MAQLFGSLTELVKLTFRETTNNNAIGLEPNQSVAYTSARDYQLPPGDFNQVLVSTNSTDTLENKTLTSPTINGGTINGLTSISVNDNGANDLIFASSDGAFTADRTLNFDLNDTDRTVDLAGNVTLAGNLTTAADLITSGAFSLTFTTTAATNVTLPTTGTLATLDGAETLTAKILTSPDINGGTADALTSLSIVDNGANDLIFNSSDGAFAADRTLNFDLNDADRTIDLAGNLTLAGAFTTSGANDITLTTTGATNVTLPTSGTIVTTDASQTLTNKTHTAPLITAGSTIDTDAAGTLTIGGTTATTVNIGRSGQTTVIGGNLQVDGTTTTVNSATLDVTDANITINNGGNQASAQNTAGLTVEMSDATDVTMVYDSALTSRWKVGDAGSEVEVVTTTGSQSLTNKDISSSDINLGTASATNKVVPSSDTFANLDALAREAGSVYYDTTNTRLVLDDGTALQPVGSGSGDGGINFIGNGTFDDNANGWTDSDNGIGEMTISQVDTGNVARGGASGEFAFTASSSAGDYIEYQFTLPAGYANSVLGLSFLHIDDSAYTADDIEVKVVKDPGGTETEYIPSVTKLPSTSTWQQFNTTVVVGAADTYSLRFENVQGAIAMDIRIDDVTLGPQQTFITTPIEGGTTVDIDDSDFTNTTGLTIDGTATYKRVGSDLHLNVSATFSGGVGSDNADMRLELDQITGMSITVPTGVYPGGYNRIQGSDVRNQPTWIDADGTSDIGFRTSPTSGVLDGDDFGTNNDKRDRFWFSIILPINEWAGSEVYLSQATPEYAFNDGTTNNAGVSNTTDFAYGPAGTTINTFDSVTDNSQTTLRVRFLTPIATTDKIEFQIRESDEDTWLTADARGIGYVRQDDRRYGVQLRRVSGSNTDVDVNFGNAGNTPNGATYDSNGQAWSVLSTYKWRLVKIPGQVQVASPTTVKYQKFTASNDYTTTSSVNATDLSHNLEVGKTYRITLMCSWKHDKNSNSVYVEYRENGTSLFTHYFDVKESGETDDGAATTTQTQIITPTDNGVMTVRVFGGTGSSGIWGTNTRPNFPSYVLVEELTTHVETNEWSP